MNLLHRLCEEEYLDENYEEAHEGGCCSTKKKSPKMHFSIAELISTIIRNVFVSSSGNYTTYSYLCEQKFSEFLNNLIVTKIFNHNENNKHAGTIIEIVKVFFVNKIDHSQSRELADCQSTCCTAKTKIKSILWMLFH